MTHPFTTQLSKYNYVGPIQRFFFLHCFVLASSHFSIGLNRFLSWLPNMKQSHDVSFGTGHFIQGEYEMKKNGLHWAGESNCRMCIQQESHTHSYVNGVSCQLSSARQAPVFLTAQRQTEIQQVIALQLYTGNIPAVRHGPRPNSH